jgi:hypothetical protein
MVIEISHGAGIDNYWDPCLGIQTEGIISEGLRIGGGFDQEQVGAVSNVFLDPGRVDWIVRSNVAVGGWSAVVGNAEMGIVSNGATTQRSGFDTC